MKILYKYNSKQKLVQLKDNSLWLVNGIPNALKSVKLNEIAKLPFFNNECYSTFDDFLRGNNISIYNHDRIKSFDGEEQLDTVLSEAREIKNPGQAKVREAMIWSLSWPGDNKPFYSIKQGGESGSDNMFLSNFCPTIASLKGYDERILLISRMGRTAEECYITPNMVEELFEGCQNNSQAKRRKNKEAKNACDIVFSAKNSIRRTGKTRIKGAERWPAEKVLENVFEDIFENVDLAIKHIQSRIASHNHSLDHHFGKERELRICLQPFLGEDPNDPKVQSALLDRSQEMMDRYLDYIKDWEWVLVMINKRVKYNQKEEIIQLSLFAA